MAVSRRRLAKLEARYGIGTDQFAPHRGDARELVSREAMRRLTGVELEVLTELLELRAQYQDMSGASFFSLMSRAHHAMEHRWVQIVKKVMRDAAEADESLTDEQKCRAVWEADEVARMMEEDIRGRLGGL